jgi:hypothetical protein
MRFANDILRFFLELAALAALAYWGATADTPVWPLLAVAAPLLLAVFWGLFMSPKAAHRLHDPLRLVGEIGVFGIAAVALLVRDQAELATALAAAAALHLVLTFALGQRRPTASGAWPS